MFSSQTARAFYDAEIHSDMPADVIEISPEYHAKLIAGQESMVIEWGDNGYPVLVEPQLPSADQLAAAERAWRDAQILATDGAVARHRDEQEEGVETTLTTEQYTELQAYRRQLREWPQDMKFPQIEYRPAPPSWLAEQAP